MNIDPETHTNSNKYAGSSLIYWKKKSNPAVGFSIALIIAGIEIVIGYILFQLFCQ